MCIIDSIAVVTLYVYCGHNTEGTFHLAVWRDTTKI